MLTDDQLRRIMPNASAATRNAALPVLNQIAGAYSISNKLRMAAWLATLAQESGELRFQEEIASGAAYEGRKDLGNTQPGDGRRFKGRGRIQITGRFNYQAYTDYLKTSKHIPVIDFIANPAKLATEPYATDAAGWFWAIKIKANPIADKPDFLRTQVLVNGRNKKTGLPNHWTQRNAYYTKAKAALPDGFTVQGGAAAAPVDSTPVIDSGATRPRIVPDAVRVLRAGMKGADVKAAQEKLIALGFLAAGGDDGDFGPKTKDAASRFQQSKGLGVDGIIGPNTRKALGL